MIRKQDPLNTGPWGTEVRILWLSQPFGWDANMFDLSSIVLGIFQVSAIFQAQYGLVAAASKESPGAGQWTRVCGFCYKNSQTFSCFLKRKQVEANGRHGRHAWQTLLERKNSVRRFSPAWATSCQISSLGIASWALVWGQIPLYTWFAVTRHAKPEHPSIDVDICNLKTRFNILMPASNSCGIPSNFKIGETSRWMLRRTSSLQDPWERSEKALAPET